MPCWPYGHREFNADALWQILHKPNPAVVATLKTISGKIRAAAPEHYMCDSGYGCEACTYEEIADLLDPNVTCTCRCWRAPQAAGRNLDDVPHHEDCKTNRGPIAA